MIKRKVQHIINISTLCLRNIFSRYAKARQLLWLIGFIFVPVSNTIAQEQTINGTVSLPESLNFNGRVSVFISLDEIGIDGQTLKPITSEIISVFTRDPQTDFELTFLEPDAGSEIVLSIRCNASCRAIDDRTSVNFFLQDDGTFDDIPNNILISELPSVVNFQFPPLIFQTITGTVSLTNGIVADSDSHISVAVSDPSRSRLDRSIAGALLVIPEGESQANYEFAFREPNPEMLLELSISCTFNCKNVDGGASQTFFLQDDGTFELEINQVRASDFLEKIDFQFPFLPLFDSKPIVPVILFLLSNQSDKKSNF